MSRSAGEECSRSAFGLLLLRAGGGMGRESSSSIRWGTDVDGVAIPCVWPGRSLIDRIFLVCASRLWGASARVV